MMKNTLLTIAVVAAATSVAHADHHKEPGPGYKDTPKITGQDWLVHDADRPRPKVVAPGASFSDLAPAPSDAVVLFDGTNMDRWTGGEWKIEDGYMEVGRGTIQTPAPFEDFQIHLEFATPIDVVGDSQGRGNSGLFLPGNHELQILDSYENPTYAGGQASALYGQWPPLWNAARGPGQWQTYDVIFVAPKWDENGANLSPAFITVIHNGVVTHHHRSFTGETNHRSASTYEKPNLDKTIKLQDHGNPTRFRNIWIRAIGDYN